MAVYKVIQDIEAEDKLLGPLSLKQFIYAAIAGLSIFIAVRLMISTELGALRWLLMFIFILPALVFGILAAPLGRDQPTEVWILAHIRFFLKPRKRVWDQSGVSELVTITAPKKVETQFVKDLSQGEVKSRLQALAATLDSRGWAVKNVNVNLYNQPGYFDSTAAQSDRLLDATSLPQAVPAIDIRAEDDILDEKSNATAQHFETLMQEAEAAKKQQLVDKLDAASKGQSTFDEEPVKPDYWFMNESQAVPAAAQDLNHAVFSRTTVIQPGSEPGKKLGVGQSQTEVDSATAKALLEHIHKTEEAFRKRRPQFRKAKSLAQERHDAETERLRKEKEALEKQLAELEARKRAQMNELSKNDDFSVATIAQQAKRKAEQAPPTGEVVINVLHEKKKP